MDDGSVYASGYNDHGQLGLGTADHARPHPVLQRMSALPRGATVTQVACGARHTVLLTDDGAVFSCGVNDQGQLGLGSTDFHRHHCRTAPQPLGPLPGGGHAAQVAAGAHHTWVLAAAPESTREEGAVWRANPLRTEVGSNAASEVAPIAKALDLHSQLAKSAKAALDGASPPRLDGFASTLSRRPTLSLPSFPTLGGRSAHCSAPSPTESTLLPPP